MLLLTNGTDSIGRHIVAACVQEERCVRAMYPLDDEAARAFVADFPHTDIVEWQGTEIEGAVADYLWEGVHSVMHTRSFTPYPQMRMHTEDLLNKALEEKVRHFIYIGTAGILSANPDQFYIDETSDLFSETENEMVAAEREVWRADVEGLPIHILSPSYVWGALPGEALFFPAFVNEHKIACVHAKDIARVAMRLTPSSGKKLILNAAYMPISLWKQQYNHALPALINQVPIRSKYFSDLFPDFTYTAVL